MDTVVKNRFVLGRQSSLAPHNSDLEEGLLLSSELTLPENMDKAMVLLFLSCKGDEKGIEWQLSQGTNVNSGDFDDRTALHVAACEGHAKVVELLLKHGANVNASDRWGSTPLADAMHYGNKDVCAILERAGAQLPQRPANAPMEVVNPADVPEYEVNAKELGNFKRDPKLPEFTIGTWHGTQVALKEIPDDLSHRGHVVSLFRDELALLQKLRHPNIVQFLGAVTQSTPMRIIVEYCAGGDLHWYLEQKGQLELPKAVRYALDIAMGLNYLHQWKPDPIIHRELKPRNILRDRVGRLKVADFYLGQILNADSSIPSRHYMAPELLLGKAFDKQVDVYSFGIILYQMIEGRSEFFLRKEEDVIQAVCHENIRPSFRSKDKHYPQGLKKLIEACWDKDPMARPCFGRIITDLELIKPLCVKQSLWRRVLKAPKRTTSLRSLSFKP